jgi:hypothetical protein
MISIRSGVFVAVNRPPGCGIISAIMLIGLVGSGFGLLGLTEATSNAALGDTAAGGAAGAWRERCRRHEQGNDGKSRR